MDRELIARVEDLYRRAQQKNQAAATGFLDPAELAQAAAALRTAPPNTWLASGSFPAAERQRLFFLPDYWEPEFFPLDEYLTALRVSCPFGEPTHRDYLGSLMGLGVKRESLGDIWVFPGYADVVCLPTIAGYLKENLTKVARFGVTVEPVPLHMVAAPEPVFTAVTGTVASLRADALTALAFGLSRTSAAEKIREGRLAIEHLEEANPSAPVSEGALLSLRGAGRARLFRVGGASKKGRIFVELHVFSKK